jgi:TolA-binding protein
LRISSLVIRASAIAALGLLVGCADQSANMNQLNQNEFALRGMIAGDRQDIDALRAELKRTQDQVAELQHASTTNAAGGAPADVTDRLSKLESEVNAMQVAMPAAPPAVANGTPDAGTPPVPGAPPGAPIGAAPAPPPTVASVAGGPPAAPGATAASTEPAPTWPQDLDKEIAAAQNSNDPGIKVYRKGLDAMKTGNYPSAIIQFAKVQHGFAKSPLSEPAQYFTGNAFYENGKYEQAVLQFNDLTMRFPNSRYLCESLLREGQSFVRLNDRIDARLTLQKLAGNSNCASESVAANNMLKDLGSD